MVNHFGQTVDLRVIGNLPLPAWSTLQPALEKLPWAIGSHISCEIGSRLPYPSILEHAVQTVRGSQEDLGNALFITASIDAHISARSIGLSTLLVDQDRSLLEHLKPFLRDPLSVGRSWLQQHAGHLDLETSITSDPIRDTYIQFLILELTRDTTLLYPELLDPNAKSTKFSWFVGPRPAALWHYPPDLDCTSLAFLTLPRLISSRGTEDADKTMDEILQYTVEEGTGLLNTYLDRDKIRLDLIALANVLSLFYAYGRGDNVRATEDFLLSVLRTGAYEEGSHYYTNPDFFLFAVSRLLVLRALPLPTAWPNNAKDQKGGPPSNNGLKSHRDRVQASLEDLKARFSQNLRHCISSRINTETDALGLACRIIAGARCGLRLDSCLNKLLALQQEDGSWPICVLYKFNRRDGVCWHRGLTVAMALRAVEEWESLRIGGGHGKAGGSVSVH